MKKVFLIMFFAVLVVPLELKASTAACDALTKTVEKLKSNLSSKEQARLDYEDYCFPQSGITKRKDRKSDTACWYCTETEKGGGKLLGPIIIGEKPTLDKSTCEKLRCATSQHVFRRSTARKILDAAAIAALLPGIVDIFESDREEARRRIKKAEKRVDKYCGKADPDKDLKRLMPNSGLTNKCQEACIRRTLYEPEIKTQVGESVYENFTYNNIIKLELSNAQIISLAGDDGLIYKLNKAAGLAGGCDVDDADGSGPTGSGPTGIGLDPTPDPTGVGDTPRSTPPHYYTGEPSGRQTPGTTPTTDESSVSGAGVGGGGISGMDLAKASTTKSADADDEKSTLPSAPLDKRLLSIYTPPTSGAQPGDSKGKYVGDEDDDDDYDDDFAGESGLDRDKRKEEKLAEIKKADQDAFDIVHKFYSKHYLTGLLK